MKVGKMIMPRRRRNKRWISWLIVLVLLITASVVCYLVWDNYFNDKKDVDLSKPKIIEELEEEADITEEDKVVEEDDKKVKQYEGEDPNKTEELSGVITFAGVVDEKVIIRANIDQYLNEGTCKLNLIGNGGVVAYEDSANVMSSASTATCEGFDMPLNRINDGDYRIVIEIKANEKTGTIEGTLEI